MDVVFIKVKIGLRPNGDADHPDWTQLPCAGIDTKEEKELKLRTEMFLGWFYDQISGHQDDSIGSPLGVQYGMLGVSDKFANEAKQMWPDKIEILTEVQAEDFYNNRVTVNQPENRYDADELQGLYYELQLKKELAEDVEPVKTRISMALNPENDVSGVRKNKTKIWTDLKTQKGIEVIQPKL